MKFLRLFKRNFSEITNRNPKKSPFMINLVVFIQIFEIYSLGVIENKQPIKIINVCKSYTSSRPEEYETKKVIVIIVVFESELKLKLKQHY
jgi:hypothetical protein